MRAGITGALVLVGIVAAGGWSLRQPTQGRVGSEAPTAAQPAGQLGDTSAGNPEGAASEGFLDPSADSDAGARAEEAEEKGSPVALSGSADAAAVAVLYASVGEALEQAQGNCEAVVDAIERGVQQHGAAVVRLSQQREALPLAARERLQEEIEKRHGETLSTARAAMQQAFSACARDTAFRSAMGKLARLSSGTAP